MEFMYTTEAPKGHLPLTNDRILTVAALEGSLAERTPDLPRFAAARGCASDMLVAAAQPPGVLRLSQCTLRCSQPNAGGQIGVWHVTYFP